MQALFYWDFITIYNLRFFLHIFYMTRINVIPVFELSDQHLIAEYHELPRVIKQKIDTSGAPGGFVLGTGHMRWARAHWKYTCDRFCEICDEMEYRGFNVNFAPVIDVNNNPSNPVINDRSFGENKFNVAEKGWMYAKGMQDNGVLAVGKHFPGHGDTDVDSHKAMPIINHDRNRLDSIELYPFRYLSQKGVGGIMVSHLFVPSIDSTENLPASLSPKAVKEALRNDVNFHGMVFTDALNMGGITTNYKGNEADVMALLAGNDMIMFPTDVKDVIEKLKSAIAEGKISERDIDEACNRVLLTKLRLGLDKGVEPISTKNIYTDLNDVQARLMQQHLIENALTLAKNQDSIVPIMHLDSVKIASVSFESTEETMFQKRLRYYADE